MAIAVKDTVSGTLAAGSSSSISMPSNSAGDVVVAWFGQDYNASDSIATLSGFTTVTDSNLSSRPIARSAYAVNPGATATLTSGSTTGRDLAYILRSYSGVDTTSPLTGSSSRASSATGTPNPPSITPAVNGAMVVALGVIENESDTAYSAPSGYSNLRVQSALEGAATNVVMMMADFLQTTAAAENPAAFTHASASNENSGITLALKPAAGINGTASITEAADTVSATGRLTTNGTLSKTEAADTVSATGRRTTNGVLAKTEAADTAASTAQRTTHAVASITEAADTTTFTGKRTTHGTASITEAADTLVAGIYPNRTGSLAATEQRDTLVAEGYSYVIPGWHVREATDTEAWSVRSGQVEEWTERTKQAETWTRRSAA